MTQPTPGSVPIPSAAAESVTRAQRIAFTLALAGGSRVIQLRDRLFGRVPRRAQQADGLSFASRTIISGRNRIDAVFARPECESVRATVLICHGIGEVVTQWMPIQRLLATRGVASLVFDYSGYGRSTGWPTPAQLEQDAIAAFAWLSAKAPGPVSLLGFSLGTGLVPAILGRVSAHRLVLCSGFTSFRSAARCVGIPEAFFALVPPVWASELALRASVPPVLVVHSTGDRLFPVAMARELASCFGACATLRIVEGLHHNEPFYKPTPAYWDPIAEFLAAPERLVG